MAHLIDKDAVVAEIERLINEIYAGRPFDSLSSEQQTALWYVKSIMSSVNTLEVKEMQEEPVSVWHDSNEEPNNMSHCLVFYGNKSLIGHYLHYEPVLYNKQDKVFVTVAYPHPTGYKVEQKSLDGGCVADVYKDKRDRISISDITSWCYLNDLHNLTQKEEPVSEELEEVSKEWLIPQLDKSYANYGEGKMMELTKFDGYAMLDAIEFGAKWQKQQDDREIKMVRELLADFDKHCDEYHEAGFKHGQEALMKDAVVSLVTDVIIHNDGDEVKYSVAYPIGKRPFNKGDKVKVIVIKED